LWGCSKAEKVEEAVPLALAGAGTRQLAMFQLTAALMDESPVVILDEPELGLEPYRQRRLVAEVRSAIGEHGQAFLTTHSPAIVEALEVGEVSRLLVGGDPQVLDGAHIGRVQKDAPDALLSRLPVLCEGDTEAGFLAPVLNHFSNDDGLPDIDSLGIRLVARTGQPLILDETEELLHAGIACGLFVDNEEDHSGHRTALAKDPRCAFGTWDGVRNVEEAVATWLPWDQLARVLDLAAELRGRPASDLLQQIGQCIGKPGTATLGNLQQEFGEAKVREAVAAAMQSKGSAWFKTLDGGEALGALLLELGMPPSIEQILGEFWRRVCQESGWA
jgi:hypothetical protein